MSLTGLILLALSVVLTSGFFAYLFGKSALKKRVGWKKIATCIAAIYGAISVALSLYLLYEIFFSKTADHLIGSVFIGSLLVIVLSIFLLFFSMRKVWQKVICALAIPLFITLGVWMFLSIMLYEPMYKREAKYSEVWQVDSLLNVNDLPPMMFERAAYEPEYGKTVLFKLVNEADSAKLTAVFEALKARNPMQVDDDSYLGHYYMTVDNDRMEFTNIQFFNDGLKVVYGPILSGENQRLFASIGAPLPEFQYIRYASQPCGPDTDHLELIKFTKPVSWQWLAKVKKAANDSEHWEYEETSDAYKLGFSNGESDGILPRVYLYMNICKNGGRRYASVNWGDY